MLKPAHKKFVKSYIENGGNGTQAVIEAFPEVKSYDYQRRKASDLLTNNHIKNEIEAISAAQGITVDHVINELNKIIRSAKITPSDKLKAIQLWLNTTGKLINKTESKSVKVNIDTTLDHLQDALRNARNEALKEKI